MPALKEKFSRPTKDGLAEGTSLLNPETKGRARPHWRARPIHQPGNSPSPGLRVPASQGAWLTPCAR